MQPSPRQESNNTEQRLSDFVRAVYGVYEAARGTEDPSIMEPRLEAAKAALAEVVTQLTAVLGSLNRRVS
jgi:hypothetical protein